MNGTKRIALSIAFLLALYGVSVQMQTDTCGEIYDQCVDSEATQLEGLSGKCMELLYRGTQVLYRIP